MRAWEEASTEGAIPILLIGFLGAPRRSLRDIFTSPQWEIREAPTYRQAAGMLDDRQIGVTICDAETGSGNWQGVIAALQRRTDPPNVIISSRLADERLWAEVLNLGGYDVLVQPFDRDEVLRVTHMAWMAWRRKHLDSARGLEGDLRMRAAT